MANEKEDQEQLQNRAALAREREKREQERSRSTDPGVRTPQHPEGESAERWEWQEYPKVMYHPNLSPVSAANKEEEEKLKGGGWRNEPFQQALSESEFGLDALTRRVDQLELRVAELYRMQNAVPGEYKFKRDTGLPGESESTQGGDMKQPWKKDDPLSRAQEPQRPPTPPGEPGR